MTDEELAACLLAAAKAMHDNDFWWDAGLSDHDKQEFVGDADRIVSAFLHAAAGLPNSHKLVGKEATGGMVDAAATAIAEYENALPLPEICTPETLAGGARVALAAAHDAAPGWSGR